MLPTTWYEIIKCGIDEEIGLWESFFLQDFKVFGEKVNYVGNLSNEHKSDLVETELGRKLFHSCYNKPVIDNYFCSIYYNQPNMLRNAKRVIKLYSDLSEFNKKPLKDD